MFNGKMKAVTFSYDDGVTQDVRLIEILNKYNLKATFNLNSGLLGRDNTILYRDSLMHVNKCEPADVAYIYQGHEVAVHTLTHPLLRTCSDEEVIRQVEQDRLNLSDLVGYEVVGMAYPGGASGHEYVAQVIREHTGVKYARTTNATHNFDVQTDLYLFNPTVYGAQEPEKMFELGQKFVDMKPDKPQVFYIWGHSYEFDGDDSWRMIEEFCKFVSNREDIFYGTNKEILL